MLRVIVLDVPFGDEERSRTIAEMVIRDDQTGMSVLGRMLIHRRDRDGREHIYTVLDDQIRRRDIWSLIGHVGSQGPSRRGRIRSRVAT